MMIFLVQGSQYKGRIPENIFILLSGSHCDTFINLSAPDAHYDYYN